MTREQQIKELNTYLASLIELHDIRPTDGTIKIKIDKVVSRLDSLFDESHSVHRKYMDVKASGVTVPSKKDREKTCTNRGNNKYGNNKYGNNNRYNSKGNNSYNQNYNKNDKGNYSRPKFAK